MSESPRCETCGRRGPGIPNTARSVPAIVLCYTCKNCRADVELGIHSERQMQWAYNRAVWRLCLPCYEKK